jgi:sulfite reductase alpha subunit-like flavoprotein
VAKLIETTKYGRTRLGTCSSFLCGLSSAESPIVYVWIKKGVFSTNVARLSRSLDFDSSIPSLPLRIRQQMFPLLLVGPGTGIAPMRAIIRERYSLIRLYPALANLIGDILCFFGCRHQNVDYLYKDEWSALGNCMAGNAHSC